MTDDELMNIGRPFATNGSRWPSDWLEAMRAAVVAEREACANVVAESERIRARSNAEFSGRTDELLLKPNK